MTNAKEWAVVHEFFETLYAHIIDPRLVQLMRPLTAPTIPELVLSQREFDRLADDYSVEHRKIDLTLQDRVLPAATRIGSDATTAVRKAKDYLDALMSSLRDHCNRRGDYFYWRRYYEETLQRASILERHSINISTAEIQRVEGIESCPICQRTENTFGSFYGPELREHFQDHHLEPERDEFIQGINDTIIKGRKLIQIAPGHGDSQYSPKRMRLARCRKAFEKIVKKWKSSGSGIALTKDAVVQQIRERHPGLTRKNVDDIWKELAPPAWKKPGRRSC